LAHPFISGVILFSRNYESIPQLRELTRQIKKINTALIITVDQEGGRVQRFREGFTELPAMQHWGLQYPLSPEKTKKDFSRILSLMVHELQDVGIYSSLVPALDIDYHRNQVIGHRSFGSDPALIETLASFFIDQFHALKMPVTGKHFPGHGWVTVDSHVDLPIDDRTFKVISQQDLKPFTQLSSKLDAMMLAHVVYEAVDAEPVLFSHFWIQEVVRKQLRFDGVVMSDDLSMQALAKMGSYDDRAKRALTAGCDILLVCNNRTGVIQILDRVLPPRNVELMRRMRHYGRFLA